MWKKVIALMIISILCSPTLAKAEENDWQEKMTDQLSLEEVEEVLEEMGESAPEFSFREYVRDIMQGKAELSLDGITSQFKEELQKQWQDAKGKILRTILFGVASGAFLLFSRRAYQRQMGETGFLVIYYLTMIMLMSEFYTISDVAMEVLQHVLDFMKALIPCFSLSLVWSTGSTTAFSFYHAAVLCIGIVENIMCEVFFPLIQIGFLVGILNPLSDYKFTKWSQLLQSMIRFGTKTVVILMIGHQGIKGLLTPALDQVKRGTLFRTANHIPGVGNMFGTVTDTFLGTSVLIKSAVGIGGLVVLCILCFVPVLRLGIFSFTYHGVAAVVQPVADQRFISLLQSVADSGKQILNLVIMTVLLFFLTLTIVIAATNQWG